MGIQKEIDAKLYKKNNKKKLYEKNSINDIQVGSESPRTRLFRVMP